MTEYKMTDEDKKLVFEYMGFDVIPNWEPNRDDMECAVNEIKGNGDWERFSDFARREVAARFFELMAKWLEEQK